MQFDAILKPKKGSRVKKRKKDAEDLDQFADEEVSRLRESMLGAAADDEQANREKLPATNKLKLLPQVMEVLRKYAAPFSPSPPLMTSHTGNPSLSPSWTTTFSRASADGSSLSPTAPCLH
jgi:hypothetical protein